MIPNSQSFENPYTIQMLLQETYAHLAAVERETKELMTEEKLKLITDTKDTVKEMLSHEGELNQKIIENYENKIDEARQEAKEINWGSLPRPS